MWSTLRKQVQERRTRARKCSSKWFVHTARHIMRTEFPNDAARFRGSRSWMRRFFRRYSLCRRKKTNVKNTTWEETRPKLERYYRATRRRLRDPSWHAAVTAALAAIEAAAPPPVDAPPTEAPPAAAPPAEAPPIEAPLADAPPVEAPPAAAPPVEAPPIEAPLAAAMSAVKG